MTTLDLDCKAGKLRLLHGTRAPSELKIEGICCEMAYLTNQLNDDHGLKLKLLSVWPLIDSLRPASLDPALHQRAHPTQPAANRVLLSTLFPAL